MSGISSWVTAKDLRHRLDADFYRPEYLEVDHRAEARGLKMRQVVEISSLVTDGTHKTPSYVDSGVPFLSAKNIRNGFVDAGSGHKYVSAAEFDQLERWNCAPRHDDVLVAKSGSIGSAGLAKGAYDRFAVFESVAIIRPSVVSSAYLSAYLNSRLGQLQIRRNSKGAVIRHLHLEDLREVEVPLPDRRIQEYIGAKVELAERCHAVAIRAQAFVDAALTASMASVGLAQPDGSDSDSTIFVADLADLSEIRLDPKYYRPRFINVGEALRRVGSKPAHVLLMDAKYGASVPADYASEGVGFIRGVDLAPNRLGAEASCLLDRKHEAKLARARVETGDVLITRSGTVGVAAAVSEKFHGSAFGSYMIRLRFRAGIDPTFAAAFINGPWGSSQVERLRNGAVQENINLDELGRILFPPVSLQQQQRVAAAVCRWNRLVDARTLLVDQAKADVEALIEGTLDVQAILAGTLKAPTADDIPELAEDDA
ncbi:MAG: restriction endonuclease subunit S [Sphingobacteriia bacterium]|nr:restriction endonuclease subunit S [Sphingobacteriia bacterium]NCC40246.1 restriction endonuclease subunit S [Gammaproteobacteria bacterium]